MIRIALTGSIGMGKSTTAKIFRRFGIPVHDIDAAVHRLYAKGGAAVAPVAAAFPGVVKSGAIDRTLLSKAVMDRPDAIRALEKIVHPLVRATEAYFVRKARAMHKPVVLFDIPLLFESRGAASFDYVIVVTAPFVVQRSRVLARRDMTLKKFEQLLARQMPDRQKRRAADYVIQTGLGKRAVYDQIHAILAKVRGTPSKRQIRKSHA